MSGIRNQFLVGRFHGFKTVDVRLRKLIGILNRGLPNICAYIERDPNLIPAVPPSDIEEQVNAMGHRGSVDAAASESFKGLLGVVFEFG
jgi:hypothetical protein